RVFYRRIEATGLENVPESGPVLFVANHANGLVDPILVLALVSRPITFVAKSTLWKVPLLGSLLDALGAVPVVRRADASPETAAGADRNDASLHRLAEALDAGGAVLIFPEGRSHSDPFLSPIRTGAARVLLLALREVALARRRTPGRSRDSSVAGERTAGSAAASASTGGRLGPGRCPES